MSHPRSFHPKSLFFEVYQDKKISVKEKHQLLDLLLDKHHLYADKECMDMFKEFGEEIFMDIYNDKALHVRVKAELLSIVFNECQLNNKQKFIEMHKKAHLDFYKYQREHNAMTSQHKSALFSLSVGPDLSPTVTIKGNKKGNQIV